MVRLVALLLLLLAAGWPAARANAGEAASICRAQSVRDVMARAFHKQDYYARIMPEMIAELPDATPNTVLCDVMDRTLTYDARVAAGVPVQRFERHLFRVRAVPNGFVVGLMR